MIDAAEARTLVKGYRGGTHRLVAPEETFARVRSHMEALGVTRLADLTGLDRVGLPVYCAIRPRGVILQAANGKGARRVDAQVSALMEALEHDHAEHPLPHLRRASAHTLQREGERVVRPDLLAQHRANTYWSDDFVLHWVPADDLLTGTRAWLPASAVYTGVTPCLHDFTGNGLASGNHVAEATLHGLYEVLERDAISRLSAHGRIRLAPPACRVVRPATLIGPVRDLHDRLDAADVTLVLLAVRSVVARVQAFWAVLIDRAPFSASSTVNVGYGAHASPEVAATRAITEAAQSRVCYIHGAREDLAAKMPAQSPEALQSIAARFTALAPDAAWSEFDDGSSVWLDDELRRVLADLAAAGLPSVFRADLTRWPFEVPVVKVVIPGMRFNRRFF